MSGIRLLPQVEEASAHNTAEKEVTTTRRPVLQERPKAWKHVTLAKTTILDLKRMCTEKQLSIRKDPESQLGHTLRKRLMEQELTARTRQYEATLAIATWRKVSRAAPQRPRPTAR